MAKYIFVFIVGLSNLTFGQQTQSDSYTRYELLDPVAHSFRIVYDVSATTEGARYYFNTLRKGSEHMVDDVFDLMTGNKLKWQIVNGEQARSNGHANADMDGEYLMISLSRPVPKNGEIRLRIDKTYRDPDSYYATGDSIVFVRSLGIKRNSVVLSDGYELVACNYPSQVELENGRIKTSFINRGDGAVNYKVTGKKLKGTPDVQNRKPEKDPWPEYEPTPQGRDKSKARLNYEIRERAFQDREIVYYLQPPETNSFRLYHDYTEKREGIDKYLNIVRPGSKASDPSAYILDTGQELDVETLRGQEIIDKGIEIGEPVTEKTEVVVIWFDPVKKGGSVRLRIWETYTDPNRYLFYNNELVWDRSFGRNRNDVVLPDGWFLTTNSIPGIIDRLDDGRIRIRYVNDRPDNIDVLIKARRK